MGHMIFYYNKWLEIGNKIFACGVLVSGHRISSGYHTTENIMVSCTENINRLFHLALEKIFSGKLYTWLICNYILRVPLRCYTDKIMNNRVCNTSLPFLRRLIILLLTGRIKHTWFEKILSPQWYMVLVYISIQNALVHGSAIPLSAL